MQVVRVDEIPAEHHLRPVSHLLDGRDAWMRARMIAGLGHRFDVKKFLTERYGEPSVNYNEALCWRLKLEQEFYVELQLAHSELVLWIDSSHMSSGESGLILSHFLAMLVEESKNPWEKKPLGMERVMPVEVRAY